MKSVVDLVSSLKTYFLAKDTEIKTALANNINENGCKNVLPNNLTSKTEASMSIVVDDKGIITLDGTASANFDTANTTIFNDVLGIAGTFVLSDSASGATSNTKCMFYGVNGGSTARIDGSVEITLTETDVLWVGIYCASGTVGNGFQFKPMLCLKSDYDLDPTYVPPTKTNLQLTQDSVSWTDEAQIGAVNYCQNNATSASGGGLTYTVNANKSVTVAVTDGTYPFTVTSDLYINLSNGVSFAKGTYKRSGCPSGGSLNTYFIGGSGYADIGDGYVFTLLQDSTIDSVIAIKSGTVLTSELTFYPMITAPSYNGPYVPYAKTNRELTDDTITQTDVTFTPDTTKVTVKNANLYREGKHIRGRLDLQVVDTAGGALGTFNKTAAYITPMYAYVGDRTTIDNQPAYSYVNQSSLVINPVSAFVANDRIQVAVDFYTA